MVKAAGQDSPHYRLNKFILRIALADAREMVERGVAPADAARESTPGAWAEFRPHVLGALLGE